jgi:amino-acid N-acetyltransferase
MKYSIQKLKTQESLELQSLINKYAEQKLLLHKSLDEIYHLLRGFRIIKNEHEKIIACAHLDLFTEELAEVKSLVVAEEYQGLGLGRKLVEDCQLEAKELGIKKLFALTYQEEFFKKLDFEVVDLKTLPEKVFKECVTCPFFNNCNEIAMLKFI